MPNLNKILSLFNPIFLLTLALSLSFLANYSLFSYDTWWQIAQGQEIVKNGNYQIESFSYTAAGEPIYLHAWLSAVIFYWLTKIGGLALLQIFGCGLIAICLLLNFANCRLLGASALSAFLFSILFIFCTESLLILRPQLFSFVLTALVFNLYLKYKINHKKTLWILPIIFVLWSNLHGGFLFGLLLLLGFSCVEFLEKKYPAFRSNLGYNNPSNLLIMAVICGLAAAIHPEGFKQYSNTLAHDPFALSINQHINEWLAPDPNRVRVFYLSLILAIFIAAFKSKKIGFLQTSCLLGTSYLAISSWRHISLYAQFALPVLASWSSQIPAFSNFKILGRFDYSLSKFENLRRDFICTILFFFALCIYSKNNPQDLISNKQMQAKFPVHAVDWIKKNKPTGNMYNAYEWGGFLIYSLAPDYKVYIDSRLRPYHNIYPEEYFKIANLGTDFEETMLNRKIDWVIIKPSIPLRYYLDYNPTWKLSYSDEQARVYTKTN